MEPSTALVLSAAASAAGSLISGVSQSLQARDAAAYDSANARIVRQQSAAAADLTREKALRLGGQQRAAVGASGVALDGSSFADAMDDSAVNAELDALTEEYGGRLQARNYRAQAAARRSEAKGALVQGVFGAGAKALDGYGAWLRS